MPHMAGLRPPAPAEEALRLRRPFREMSVRARISRARAVEGRIWVMRMARARARAVSLSTPHGGQGRTSGPPRRFPSPPGVEGTAMPSTDTAKTPTNCPRERPQSGHPSRPAGPGQLQRCPHQTTAVSKPRRRRKPALSMPSRAFSSSSAQLRSRSWGNQAEHPVGPGMGAGDGSGPRTRPRPPARPGEGLRPGRRRSRRPAWPGPGPR